MIAVRLPALVVSLPFSTSSHNSGRPITEKLYVVSLPFSTSSHNDDLLHGLELLLYLFPFLHQATTCRLNPAARYCCISSLFYIKPQHYSVFKVHVCVVSLPFSTSSHNHLSVCLCPAELYLFPFLHQATTISVVSITRCSCISSLFYIKPQL